MTHVFHRNCGAPPPTAVQGDGCYIIDSEGKRYLDASGGAAVSCLGHSHPRVIQAMKDQMDALSFAHTGFFTNKPLEDLADFLISRAPDGLDYAYFVSGGSEAIETALKLAYQYFWEKGEGHRHRYIARRQSYHGNTMGALAVGGNMWRREQFAPILIDVEHISPCYAYRDQRADESLEDYGLRAANDLEARLLEVGPENVIAFVAEPVGGATSGALVPAPGYLRRIREICTQYGILLILDEVMCGMGRTGALFACSQDDVTPDILAIAKGLGAGYQPSGATLCSAEIYNTIHDGSGFFQHGHTYLGHPIAAAAALAVQKTIEDEDLLDNVTKRGAQLMGRLQARFGNHPLIGDIRGRGLFMALELVADRSTKEPLDPALKIHLAIKKHAMARGLMCYPGGGTIDGKRGNHVLLAPPFIIDDSHVDEIVEKLGASIDAALADAGLA